MARSGAAELQLVIQETGGTSTGIRRTGDDLNPPEDRQNRVYIALLLCGVGLLLPYNSFIVATDYFKEKHPGTTIVFDMSLVYILCSLVAVSINNFTINAFSYERRIVFGYAVSIFVLVFVAVFIVFLEAIPQSHSYCVVLIFIGILALGCTVQQSSFYGYTSMMPSRYTQAVMVGESTSGFLVSFNRMATKLAVTDTRINTLRFFQGSIVIMCACGVANMILRKSELVNYYVSNQRTVDDTGSDSRESAEELPESVQSHFGESCTTTTTTTHVQDVLVAWTIRDKRNISSLPRTIKKGMKKRLLLAAELWPYMTSTCLTYFVTLCLFPGIQSEIVSCALGSWMPVSLMAVFNLTDLVGKVLSSVTYPWHPTELVLGAVSRAVLIPLTLLCVETRYWPPITTGEAWPLTLSALLGLTNGIFGCVPMVLGPKNVAESKKELAGNIMTISYSAGLTLGTTMAYGLNEILRPKVVGRC